MSVDSTAEQNRQTMEADIVCVGFGPAAGGFLTELTRELAQDGGATLQSSVMPGMPLQVICYERADDVGFGVSGVVSRARAIRTSFPELNPADVPMAAEVSHEEVLYLLDPGKASRRSALVRFADTALRLLGPVLPLKDHAFKLPYIPPFLRKEPGLTFSLGQFTQWAAGQVMGSGMAQIWPGMPVAAPLFEGERVCGVRLLDQGTDLSGAPGDGYMPGMDIRAALTVVADGPVGAVGQALNRKFGLPPGNEQFEWAVGAKMVVELAPGSGLKPGTVLHTFGYPEPEIFGFLYVHPDNLASLGIFVPSTFGSPARTSYRYLQQWMKHPALAGYLAGAELRSWGAKSLLESGRRGEPYLAGD
ncbi:MAG TPA: 4Fe-4S ferredoxin, partial [Oligoflexia bacterium]|nr:4Fe-4S ferredoxin [Oligoflexia bacterium]